MDTKPLERFATQARRDLLSSVDARATAVLAAGSIARAERPDVVRKLEAEIAAHGRAHVVDKVAYTWFNRIIALRFMDARGYTDAGIVSPAQGRAHGQPEILAEAKRGNLDADVVNNKTTAQTVLGLLDGTRRSTDAEGEAYALLLTEYCRYWHKSMPFMFEREGDYTELLVPAGLLAGGAIVSQAREVLTEDVCDDVEVIGWLYQFYISERKDEVFAGFKKNKKAGADEIPAATQLFTPHWIVKYLVENTIGRIWMLNRPHSRLVDLMEYYVAPVNKETEFLKIASPEELSVIDPACGSGHLLTFAFDLLYAIYQEEGYAPSDIPGLILTHNLHGTEIDPRAGSLAAFALTMKARARQRTFFNRQIAPEICVLEPISFDSAELDVLATSGGDRATAGAFWNQFQNADVLGALTRVQPEKVVQSASVVAEKLERNDLLTSSISSKAEQVLRQATFLSPRYSAVIANPPYMGNGNMNSVLSEYARAEYVDSRQDLCTMFIEQGIALLKPKGRSAMIMPHSWMFLVSFSALRERLLQSIALDSVVHLGRGVFGSDFASVAFVLENERPTEGTVVTYRKLYDEALAVQSNPDLIARFKNQENGLRLVHQIRFLSIPKAPLVFSLGEDRLRLFAEHPPLHAYGKVAVGLQTSDNPRFLRFWHEVDIRRIGFGLENTDLAATSPYRWFPYNKGGVPRRWWGNQNLVVNWEADGAEIKAQRPRSVVRNPGYYFRPAISWSNVGGVPAFREYPPGFIPDSAGSSFYPDAWDRALGIMAFLNSKIMREILEAIAPTLHFDVGQVGSLPVPRAAVRPSSGATELVQFARDSWAENETSWDFQEPRMIRLGQAESRIAAAVDRIRADRREAADRTLTLERENDMWALAALGLLESDPKRNAAAASVDSHTTTVSEALAEEMDEVRDLVSFAVGCIFGRFSLDASGLIVANQGSTLQDHLAKVPAPRFRPGVDNVIPFVDDGWFDDDIVERIREFLRVAFGPEHFEENLRFVEESLGVKALRDYFITRAGKSKFYDDHVQRYKKRPIYWMFSSPKGSFNALIYMHRYNPSTVSTVLNEYLREYRAKLEVALANADQAAAAGSNKDQKEADRLRKVLAELSDYEHDVLYPLATEQIAIDLDDGVKVNYPKFYPAVRKIVGLEAAE